MEMEGPCERPSKRGREFAFVVRTVETVIMDMAILIIFAVHPCRILSIGK